MCSQNITLNLSPVHMGSILGADIAKQGVLDSRRM
jgi:hypothetical protein